MQLLAIAQVLSEWAQNKPLVLRAWVFGSRARDDYRPESDLDIAIELDSTEFPACDESGGYATWMFETTEWATELQKTFPYQVQLEQFIAGKTPTIEAGLQHSSYLAYKKPD